MKKNQRRVSVLSSGITSEAKEKEMNKSLKSKKRRKNKTALEFNKENNTF